MCFSLKETFLEIEKKNLEGEIWKLNERDILELENHLGLPYNAEIMKFLR